jgi:protein-disulfide isomerase
MSRVLVACLTALCLLPVTLPGGAAAQQSGAVPQMPAEARAALHNEIRTYLLENPEVILEAINVLEERRAEEAQRADGDLVAQHAEALFSDGHSWVAGNPDGDVTVVEFSDYRCGFCKRAHPVVQDLLAADGNIRLVYKEFPILGPASVTAGRMAIAAFALDPERFPALNDALLTYQGDLTEVAAYRIAKDAGYDVAELKTAAAGPEVDAKLKANYEVAQALGLQGTPSFVIGTEVVRGFLPLDQMQATVAQARAQSN